MPPPSPYGQGWQFLSTPSARRATMPPPSPYGQGWHFYPRPPRGGRPRRAPRCPSTPPFLSTPSARRATGALLRFIAITSISIHALREEGDYRRVVSPSRTANFYPRPPRGGRLLHFHHYLHRYDISIHALREEGDPVWKSRLPATLYFYPRPPRGGRRSSGRTPRERRNISIHALREEGDGGYRFRVCAVLGISIHALREEGDLQPSTPTTRAGYFYPRPPRGGRPPDAINAQSHL